MKLRVLGCSGSNLPGYHLTAFLLNDHILLDAGAVTESLSLEEQRRITDIFITHAHLDHTKDILFLADNRIEFEKDSDRSPPAPPQAPVVIHGLPEVLEAISDHLLNDTIWPDFTVIPTGAPVLAMAPLSPRKPLKAGLLTIAACPVNHAKHACGYIIKGPDEDETLAYTGDTGQSPDWWRYLATLPFEVKHVIIEASFPNRLEPLAMASKHLTPKLLRQEIESLPYRPEVHISHMKSPFSEQIRRELREALSGYSYSLLREEDTLEF